MTQNDCTPRTGVDRSCHGRLPCWIGLGALLLAGCRTADFIVYEPSSSHPLLPPMIVEAPAAIKWQMDDGFFAANGEDYRGTLRLVTVHDQESRDPSWYTFPSIFTLGALNLVGLPFLATEVNVTLELTVSDSLGEDLFSARADGSGSAWVACWYGYNGRDARRMALLEANKEALLALWESLNSASLELH